MPQALPLSKSTLAALSYFRLGYMRDPEAFWVAPTNYAARVSRLLGIGFLERCDRPGCSDLFRIKSAGLEALSMSEGGA